MAKTTEQLISENAQKKNRPNANVTDSSFQGHMMGIPANVIDRLQNMGITVSGEVENKKDIQPGFNPK